jgi:hypothetical protein
MPKHIVRRYTMAAFFFCLTKQRAISTRQSFVYVLFLLSDWELGKTGANNGFLSCLKMYLYVFSNRYKGGFPGIEVWNVLLNFTHVYRWDYLWLKTELVCGLCQLNSLLGVLCVRHGGIIVKFSLCVGVCERQRFLLVNIFWYPFV